ncbi:MAG: hypothetical protein NT141_02745 [candidate division WWE3 bacterium]|nr:hypothetical protein [candidate division WWE3 bacterium]
MTFAATENDNFITLLKKIRANPDNTIEVVVKSGLPILDNVINLKLLTKEALDLGKSLEFKGTDPQSEALIGGIFGTELVVVAPVAAPELLKSKFDVKKIISSFNFKRFRPAKFGIIFGAIVVAGILLVIISGVFLTNLPRATVTLKFSTDSLAKSLVVNLSEAATAVDSAQAILPAQKIVIYATASAGAATTGTKIEGDYAKGTITVLNKTDHAKTFPKNTLISLVTTSNNNLAFNLDKEINVPARSVATVSATPQGETTTYEYGKVTATVTAQSYGDQFNIAGGSQLSVADESPNNFIAQNDNGFSGGKQNKVAVVAEVDQKKLLDTVTAQLVEAIKQKFTSAIPVGLISPSIGTDFAVVGQNFDKGLGEKADNLNLTATAVSTTYAFKEDNVKTLWKALMQALVPQNYTLSPEEKQIDMSLITDTLETTHPQMIIKGTSAVVPKYVTADIQNSLAGQSLAYAKHYLELLPNIDSYKIDITPAILNFGSRMPKVPSHINVVVSKL